MVLCAATIAVAVKDTVSGGIVGLSVSYALEVRFVFIYLFIAYLFANVLVVLYSSLS